MLDRRPEAKPFWLSRLTPNCEPYCVELRTSAVIVIGAAPFGGVNAGSVMPPPTGAVSTPRFE